VEEERWVRCLVLRRRGVRVVVESNDANYDWV
jgi:hypothetical protein